MEGDRECPGNEPSKLARPRVTLGGVEEGAGELEPDRTYCRASSKNDEVPEAGPGREVFLSPLLGLPGDEDAMAWCCVPS